MSVFLVTIIKRALIFVLVVILLDSSNYLRQIKNGNKMYTAKYLSPMIPSYNLETTVLFFVNLLDFNIGRDDKTYFILYKDNQRYTFKERVQTLAKCRFI